MLLSTEVVEDTLSMVTVVILCQFNFYRTIDA